MRKKLPIGISDFKKVIEGDYYYIDKTELISSIIEESGEVKLFTRPRRFGKTLNISMIRYFFDIENREENRKLFDNLKISKNSYFEKQGTAPVISISFRNYDEKNWENGFEIIKNEIKLLFNEFYLIREKLNQSDLEDFDAIWLKKENAPWKNSLLNLCRYLYNIYGQKVVILIDEYDQPIIDSHVKGYYEEAISFFKSLYGTLLKDNKYLEMGVLTGILRVAKENIFSGLNNLEVHTIMDNRFTENFGIMENEVERALKDFNLEYELKDVQKWYNGYLFGDIKVYNPWSIINFLNRGKLKPYWVNTSGNDLIKLYLEKLRGEIFDDFSKLLNKESILKRINDNMTFSNLESDYGKNIWNLFFHSGYLTLAEESEDYGMYYLKIPNEEILKMFSEMFIDIYFDNYDKFIYMSDALRKGNFEDFKKYLQEILLENVGIFDVSGIYKEQFYHGLMLGIILILKNEYEITSNNFAGKGRYDLMMKPKNILQKRKKAIILEFKVINEKNDLPENRIQEKLKKECEIALRQIDKKEYTSLFKNAGIDEILKIGVAFLGKNVEVKGKI